MSYQYSKNIANTNTNTYLQNALQYIGWKNDVTYLWSQYNRHFVGQHRRTVCS